MNRIFSRLYQHLFAGVLCTVPIFLSSSCGFWDDDYSLREWESVEYNGSIMLSLAHPFDVKNSDFELLIAVKKEARLLGVCVDDETPVCSKGGTGFYPAEILYASNEKIFFKTTSSALLEHGLVLNILAFDQQDNLVDQRKVKFERVGGALPPAATPQSGGPTVPPAGNPSAGPNSSTSPADPGGAPGSTPGNPPDETKIRSAVSQYCGGCHASYASNPGSLKGTGAAGMISSGSMPKGRSMPQAEKQLLLDYLK